MIDKLNAERQNLTWWRTSERPIPVDPDAHLHRRQLLEALVGWRAPEREPRWRPTPYSTDELIEEVEFLFGGGEVASRVAERLGMSLDAIIQRMRRAGRNDLAAQFYTARKAQQGERRAA